MTKGTYLPTPRRSHGGENAEIGKYSHLPTYPASLLQRKRATYLPTQIASSASTDPLLGKEPEPWWEKKERKVGAPKDGKKQSRKIKDALSNSFPIGYVVHALCVRASPAVC